MAERPENPVGALESCLAEKLEAGYSDDSTAKPIARKKKNTRKRRHGESTESRYNLNKLGRLEGQGLQIKVALNGSDPILSCIHCFLFPGAGYLQVQGVTTNE